MYFRQGNNVKDICVFFLEEEEKSSSIKIYFYEHSKFKYLQ